jgi:hypothetical protein
MLLSKPAFGTVSAIAAGAVAVAGGSAAAGAGPAGAPHVAIQRATRSNGPARLSVKNLRVPVRGLSAARVLAASASGSTVPSWKGTITVGSRTFSYVMVGKNPFQKQTQPKVNIPAPIIPVAFSFAGGNSGGSFNPTKPACGEALSRVTLVKQSPIFTDLSYTDGNVDLGTGEYVDVFQRANFWKYVKTRNPGYAVNLTPSVEPTVDVRVPSGAGEVLNSGCSATGLVDQIAWDKALRNKIIPALASEGVGPRTIPVFIFRNVAMYMNHNVNDCCALGYHSGFLNNAGNPQFYTVTDIDDSGSFQSKDVSDLAHEIGEWMDDPTGNNTTPAWGHIGQVTGCQNNLEVGDPLTNTNIALKAANGRTYHPQELTFFSWFYRQKPSIGVNGFYSLAGTFTKPSQPCS